MLTRRPRSRAVAALAVVALSAVACAKRTPDPRVPEPLRRATDTSSVAIGDSKSIENMFAGRFPGVVVTAASGGGLQIRIRGGSNTFYGSNEPLYVLDETPLPQGTGGIVGVNPYDITKIEVLKNPADIAIYGIRGGNGVVKITTRKAR